MAKNTTKLNLKSVNGYLNDATTDDAIATEYKALAASADISLAHLSDVQLVAIIKSVPGKGDDVDMERVQKAADAEPSHHDDGEAGKNSLLPVEIGQTRDATLNNIAKAFSDDALTNAHMDEIENGREAVAAAPITILHDLYRQYSNGDNSPVGLKAARSVIRAFPVAGTSKSKGDNNPDRYGVPYTKDGEEKTRQTTFYGEWYDRTERGIRLGELIQKIKDASTESTDANVYASWLERDRKLEIGRLTQRRNAGINNIRRAVRIEHQLERLEEMPGGRFVVRFAKKRDDEGNELAELSRTNKPVIVANSGDVQDLAQASVYSVGQFLSWKVGSAKKATIAGLTDTVKKGAGAGASDGGAKAAAPTVKVASTFMVSLRNGLDADEWRATLVKELSKANSDVDLQNWYEVYQSLGYVFSTNHGLVKRATELQAETKESTKAA